MAQGKQQAKFERNPGIRLRDNCDKDGWTDDGRHMMDKLRFRELCWHSQAELKIPMSYQLQLSIRTPRSMNLLLNLKKKKIGRLFMHTFPFC